MWDGGSARKHRMRPGRGRPVARALVGTLIVAALAVAASTSSATAVNGLPTWPDNPDWQSLVPGPSSDDVKPVAITRSHGSVSTPQALIGGGTTVMTVEPGGPPAVVVLDYGQEVGGTPYVNVAANTPTAPATSNTLRISTSEALPFLNANNTTTLATAASAGATNVKVASVAPFYVGTPITVGTGAASRDEEHHGVGTAATTSRLFEPAATGDTNIKVTSVTGLVSAARSTSIPAPSQDHVTITVGRHGRDQQHASRPRTSPPGCRCPPLTGANWIWNVAGASTSTPPGTIYLRKTFTVADPAAMSSAVLRVNADDGHTTYVNGMQVSSSAGANNAWRTSQISDIKSLLVPGTNVIAIAPFNGGGAGSVIAAAELDGTRIVTDASWKALAGTPASPPAGWNTAGFDDSSWPAANVTGAYGIAPWNLNVTEPPGPTTLRVASVAGFVAGDTISIDTGANQETKSHPDRRHGRRQRLRAHPDHTAVRSSTTSAHRCST